MPVTSGGGVARTLFPIMVRPLLPLMQLATTNLETRLGVFTYLCSDIHYCH